MQNLCERFSAAWNQGIHAGRNPEWVFYGVKSRYSEPWRAYHTLEHIDAMLVDLDKFRECPEAQAVNIPVVEVAIWYHDVVYNPRAKDNEERSADVFRLDAKLSSVSRAIVEEIALLILATKHDVASENPNDQVLCDIDLAILGQTEAAFGTYERQIREEYAWVPEAQFREGRTAILQSFLRRPTIYSTNFFQKKYEGRALKNLVRSVEQLSKK